MKVPPSDIFSCEGCDLEHVTVERCRQRTGGDPQPDTAKCWTPSRTAWVGNERDEKKRP